MTSWWRRGPKESALEAWAVARARQHGGVLEKLAPVAGRKHRLDQVFLHPARPPAYLELKRAGEEPTQEQQHEIDRLRVLGFQAGWASTRESVETFFRAAVRPNATLALGVLAEAAERRQGGIRGSNRVRTARGGDRIGEHAGGGGATGAGS